MIFYYAITNMPVVMFTYIWKTNYVKENLLDPLNGISLTCTDKALKKNKMKEYREILLQTMYCSTQSH